MELMILIAVVLIITAFFVGRKFASKPIDDRNKEIQEKCNQLKEEAIQLEWRTKDLTTNIKLMEEEIHAAEVRQSELQTQYEEKLKVIENTKQLAEDAANERRKVLETIYEKDRIELENQRHKLLEDIEKTGLELQSLQNTKIAALEAARKEQEIQENKEFYTLQIPREERRDIEILEDTKMRISKPRAIATCIWSNYYLPVAKNKLPKILGKDKVCGIYKITNQKTQQCYIGQSTDIKKRIYEHWRAALGIDTPNNNLLYSAMKKDGIDNFSIELLLECNSKELNKKEKYFIQLYQSHIYGYNQTQGNKSGVGIDN